MDTKRNEWDELSPEQRNCLMWPDFFQWDESRDVVVGRQPPDTRLGLVSTVVQDPETNHYYHITKRIKANHPAHGIVTPYEWIFAVDGEPTTNRNELSGLIQNGRNAVRLSMKKAVDPLRSIKEWSKEKDVQLEIKEKKCGFELVHFYCKDENGTAIKDRILIWDVKPGTHDPKLSELHRGDELLEVNDAAVEGKKLAEIYKLIFQQIPTNVTLKIKEMQRRECQEVPTLHMRMLSIHENAVPSAPPQEEQPVQSPDTLAAGNTEGNSTQENRVETDKNSSNDRPPERLNTTSNSHADTEDLITPPQQESGSGGSSRKRWSIGSPKYKQKVERQTSMSENQGYAGTPEASRKTYPNSSTVKMCSTCFKTGETRLPDDRNQWRIDKIDIASSEKICKLLDHGSAGKKSLLSALPDCFNHAEASSLKQQFSAAGGVGLAKVVLEKWGNYRRSHNVGALKRIVNDVMKRHDVVEEIEKWEERSVCHGCGIRLNENN